MSRTSPRSRKTIVVLTDREWHELRVASAERDTTIQGYITELVLRALRQRRRPRQRARSTDESEGGKGTRP